MTIINPVVHFEMPAKDKKRVSDFYSKVFGWELLAYRNIKSAPHNVKSN